MTDKGWLTCDQFRESDAEIALGILPGRERAAALAHLQHCPTCRERVRELALMADGLVDLVPCCEPPIGFEARVLHRIGLPTQAPWRTRWRRVALLAAAVGAAFALGLGGWAIGSSSGRVATPSAGKASVPYSSQALLSAELTGAGHEVGKVFAYTGSSPWVYMSVDADAVAGNGRVRCQVRRADGLTATVGSFNLTNGYADWGGPYPAGSAPVSVRLIADNGSVLATATFPTTKD